MTTDRDTLFARARQRAGELALPYSGALTPQEAWDYLQQTPNARLVDVRTEAERVWVGQPPNSIAVEWMLWPARERNPNFLAQLAAEVDRDAPVLFLCRSAQRSHLAAQLATENGWATCFNILEGFEGDKDASGQRGHLGGWRHAGLPWTQS